MKTKPFVLLIFAFSTIALNAQISFEKGYYLSNTTEKVECLIKNYDWKDNPEEIEYKLTDASPDQKITIKDVKEFSIYDRSKYSRKTVGIDKSGSRTKDLDTNRNPILEEETVFLKTLLEGEASLYSYEGENLIRFFYAKENKEIEPLIFKEYVLPDSRIAKNEYYKQQLFNNLKCGNPTVDKMSRVDYDQKDLIDFFKEYNDCVNSKYKNWTEKSAKAKTNLNLRVGVSNNSLSYTAPANTAITAIDFENKFGLRIGLELEFVLPFNNGKWALIFEPYYQTYNSEGTFDGFISDVDYSSIDISGGIRHYFFLNDKSKLFLNATVLTSITLDDTIITRAALNRVRNLTIESLTPNFTLGIGFKQNDKLSLEFRYHTPRDVLGNSQTISTDYDTVSFIVGYSIF